jgi:Protein of unknown function (DUF3311)
MPVALLVAAIYALHQDIWFWREARPLVFGFLPIGLAYHAAYTLALTAFLWWLVQRHWPVQLTEEAGQLFFNGGGAPPPPRADADTSPRIRSSSARYGRRRFSSSFAGCAAERQ